MKAVVHKRYGPPEVLQLRDIEKPSAGDKEVLIRVRASTVTAVDSTFRQGKPFVGRLFAGPVRPRMEVPGTEFAGEIESVGADVSPFKAGDQVFGTTNGAGAHAEYICRSLDKITLSLKPSNLSFDESACCDGFLTALPFLRDTGKIQKGQKVLINGASGSVGTAAVQLAKYFGAEVTGVCSTANLELVKSLGADKIIDYKSEDFTQSGQSYDIIFDTVGKLSFGKCRKSLGPQGIFLQTTLTRSILPQALWTSLIGSKKARIAFTGLRPVDQRSEDLDFIRELIEAGELRAVIDRRYPFAQIVEAHRYVDSGHKKGNVVLSLG